jgi:hypothetical protein
MQFLTSIWLFAIAAISIPVVIHLWNIKPGKTLKVGSISLFKTGAQKSSRSFKLNDIPLFLLRCLLLILLALLLAVPVWQRTVTSTKTKGWFLIPKENITETYSKFKLTIDSLSKAGYEFHYFNKGFAKADLKQVLTDSVKQSTTDGKTANYWSLIAQLNEQLPADVPVQLFTPDQSKYFAGSKPEVSLDLHWQTYIPADSVSSWIQSAWFTDNNSIKVVEGNSKSSGTWFTNYIIQSGGEANSPFTVSVNNGSPVISLKNGDHKPVLIDTNSLRIAIYTDKFSTDAAYLKAALQAVSNFTRHKTSIKQYSDAGQIPAGQNWIFWLSEKTVDAGSMKKGRHVFNYVPGKVSNTSFWIKTHGAYAVSGQQDMPALYKLIKGEAANPVWVDGYGNPVLSQDSSIYHFYSRFDPAWNELVWSDQFPKLLLKLMTDKEPDEQIAQHDRRVLDQQQLMPVINPSTKNTVADKLTEQTNLSHYFWLALVVVFLVERWLAHKNKLTPKHG